MRVVHLTDFGLARASDTGSRLTRTGQALGTPAYMSPEAARGDAALTPASDVWALGCLLFDLLAGRHAFEGDTPAEVIGHILTGVPPDLARIRPDVSRDLVRVVEAALAPRAADRPPQAAALREALDRVLAGERPRVRRRRRSAVPLVLGGVVLAATGAVAWRFWPAPRPAATTSAGPGRAEQLAARAAELRRGAPQEAADLLAQSLAIEPGRHAWRVELGCTLWSLERGPDARLAWAAVPAGAPEYGRARFYLALERLMETPSDSRVRADLQVAVASGPPTAVLAQGALALIDDDVAGARARLAGIPGWEAALLRAGVHLRPGGDRAEALREYDEVVAAGIRTAWIHSNRGTLRRQLGDPTGALAEHADALARAPDFEPALVGRALALADLGRAAEGLVELEVALARNPDRAALWFNRGWLRRLTGDLAGAVQDYSEALARRSDYADALQNRAAARKALGDLPGSLADITALLGLHPEDPVAWQGRGSLRMELGDIAGARSDLDEALRLHPDYPNALCDRAGVKASQGDLAGSLADCDAALRLHPDHLLALYNRGVAYHRLERYAEAEVDYTRALALRPEESDSRHARGLVRVALGRLDGAAEDFRAVIETQPDRAEAYMNLGVAYLRLSDWRAAAAAIRGFLARAPNHPRADEFRDRLRDCEVRLRDPLGGR